MTISHKAFEKFSGDEVILGFWNNDGTISIQKKPKDFPTNPLAWDKLSDEEKAKDLHVTLEPFELKTLLKENEFHFDGIRPGLIPMREKIDASTEEDMVTIRNIPFMFGVEVGTTELTINKAILQEIYNAAEKAWSEKREEVRPLIGLNSKAGSFDGMAGTLEQDKKNEELRTKVRKYLSENL